MMLLFKATCPPNPPFYRHNIHFNSFKKFFGTDCATRGLDLSLLLYQSVSNRMSVFRARPSFSNLSARTSQELELDDMNIETVKNKVVERSQLSSNLGKPLILNDAQQAIGVNTNTAKQIGDHWARRTVLTLDGGGPEATPVS